MFRSFAGSLIISMLLLVTSSTVNASPKPEISWEKEGGDWVATVILKTDLKENNNLEVKSFSGPMTFVGDADRAWIELIIDTDEGKKEHAEELLKKAMPKWDFNGKTFTLTGSDYKETGFFFKGERQPAWQLIAHLPKSFNVKADTKGGGIEVEKLAGNCEILTRGGQIKSRDIEGDFKLETRGGNISLMNIKGTMNAETAGGEIELKDAFGDIEINTSGGNLSIANVTGNLQAFTSGGAVTVSNLDLENLELGTRGGSMHLIDIKCENPYTVKTSGGAMQLKNTAGDLTLSSGGGNISISEHKGDVDVETGAGAIEIFDLEGAVHANTGSGNIGVRLTDLSKSKKPTIELETGVGAVDLRIPKSLSADVSMRSSNSKPYVDSDLNPVEDDPGHTTRWTGKINGGGIPLRINTGSGNIQVRRI